MALHACAQEILAPADSSHDGTFWRPHRPDQGLSARTIHLYAFLKMRILGISAFYHDSAAAIIEDGRIIAAAQEERFTRKKHDASFPSNAIAYCLEAARTTLPEIDHVAFYDKPFLKFE